MLQQFSGSISQRDRVEPDAKPANDKSSVTDTFSIDLIIDAAVTTTFVVTGVECTTGVRNAVINETGVTILETKAKELDALAVRTSGTSEVLITVSEVTDRLLGKEAISALSMNCLANFDPLHQLIQMKLMLLVHHLL